MSPRFLLDTNICSYIRQKKSTDVLARFDAMQIGEAAMSAITHGELLYGAERSQNRESARHILSELITWIPILSLPDGAAEEYGKIRARLESRGQMIGTNDLWIGAHAKVAGLILVTNNEKEFRRIGGLKIENWASRK